MRDRIVMGVLVLAACLPALAVAQQQPAAATAPMASTNRGSAWELSVSGGGAYLDRTLAGWVQVTNPAASRLAVGGVVRIGYNFTDSWGLSIGSGVGRTSPAAVIQPFFALTWTPNINSRTSPFLTTGFGASFTSWSGSGQSYKITGLGWHLGFGLRQMVSDRLGLRVEAREQYERYDKASIAKPVFNSIGSVGLSWFFGGGRPKPPTDTDGDGVPDKLDRCPNTPLGAIVDARGCPIDSDRDGVPDGLDRCPDTPSGVTVDANGCPVDSDGDGVPDYLDRCPNTPSGAGVDANGCPIDTDHDGVPDYLDRCPNTPSGVSVDANGCPVDSDTDGDGVPNRLDRCPNTPAGVQVYPASDAARAGCPVDSDGDGVPDYLDRCPNTPVGTPVDATGCPGRAAAPPPVAPPTAPPAAPPVAPPVVRVDTSGGLAQLPEVNGSMTLSGVTFRGLAALPPPARAALDRIAMAIRVKPNSRWEIASYWDNRTVGARARLLTQRRAAAVRAYLVAQGIDAASLIAVGYGSQRPVADNHSVAGRAQNRRVEIKRLQ